MGTSCVFCEWVSLSCHDLELMWEEHNVVSSPGRVTKGWCFVRLFFLMLHMPPVTKQFFHPHRKERSKRLATLLGKRYMIINFFGKGWKHRRVVSSKEKNTWFKSAKRPVGFKKGTKVAPTKCPANYKVANCMCRILKSACKPGCCACI